MSGSHQKSESIMQAEHDALAGKTPVKKAGIYVWNPTGGNDGLGDWERWEGDVDIDMATEGIATETTLASIKDTDGIKKITDPVNVLEGLSVPEHDYISATYDDPTFTETYVYKTGGAGGTTVATITVIYADATKEKLVSVART